MLLLTALPLCPAAAQPASQPATEADSPAAAIEGLDEAEIAKAIDQAAALPRLRSMIVAVDGRTVIERAFQRTDLDFPANVKSVSKTVIAALVGAAVHRGVIGSVDEPLSAHLANRIPLEADPAVAGITLDHLLSMRAGLERTSGANYGRWVQSRDWVAHVLSRPLVDQPGGRMLYSTGNTHVLSAVLSRATGRSTLDLARDWLGEPLGIDIPPWERDPQGIYLGGNNMALSPRALLRLGELYRNGGTHDGVRIFAEEWVTASWTPRGRSPYSGHAYGYGWFITQMRGHEVYYAWGFGGQMIYVVPELKLTGVFTSDPTVPSGRSGYVDRLHALFANAIVAAFAAEEAAQRKLDPPG